MLLYMASALIINICLSIAFLTTGGFEHYGNFQAFSLLATPFVLFAIVAGASTRWPIWFYLVSASFLGVGMFVAAKSMGGFDALGDTARITFAFTPAVLGGIMKLAKRIFHHANTPV